MKFEEMLLKRESCRSYADKPVSREDLIKITEAGRLSPSGCNAQPWKFIVVDEPEAKAKLCDALVLENGVTGVPFRATVPAFIICVEQPAKLMRGAAEYYGTHQRFAQGDIGMAVMNMCYQAMDLGLSTCILGLSDEPKMQEAFGIPAERVVRMVLAVGYSDGKDSGRKKVRKSPEEVVSFNRW